MITTRIYISVCIFISLGLSSLPAQTDTLIKPSDTVAVKRDIKIQEPLPKDSVKTEKHPQDSQEDRGFYIQSRDSTSDLRIYGSIRIFGAYDINGLRGGTSFSISNIPTGSANKNEKSFFMTANLTRFGMEANYMTTFSPVFMKLEMDFNSDGNRLRLRHAYGSADFILAGQTWTVFSDLNSVPNTVDIDGPPTGIGLRSVQIRYFREFQGGWKLKGSIESPNININIPDSLNIDPPTQVIPDIAASLSRKITDGHLQLAGILRSISVRNLSGDLDFVTGYGGLFSGRFYVIKNFSVMFQALAGKGITSFLNLSRNNSIDVLFNPFSGGYELAHSYGGFITLIKLFPLVNITASLTYGTVNIKEKDYQPENTFTSGNYLSLNGFWFTKFGFRAGVEYNLGYSRNKKGESGTANRFGFTFYYDF